METNTTTNQIQSTFIPKQSLVKPAELSRRQAASGAFGLVTLISFIIFALSLAMLVVTYGYKYTLYQSINRPCDNPRSASVKGCGLVASIAKERDKLDAAFLTRLRRVDAKSNLAKEVLHKHETLSPLFSLLNRSTLQTVQYRKFTFAPAGVTVEGVAASYEDIALQSKAFGRERLIKGFIFSDLKLDDKGDVGFKLVMTLDPQLLSYTNYALAIPREGTPEEPASVPSAEETPAQNATSTPI